MADSLPMEVASTIQSVSINRAPSPTHDLNPSTAASQKQPVTLSHSEPSLDKYAYDSEGIDHSDLEDGEEDIPYNVLKPVPRRQSFGPLPDLRFEQSYLASIAGAESNWQVAFITFRDQLVLPLVQGMVWSLALQGWRYWNRTAELSGKTVGSKVRRWWYRTNNWKLPDFGKNWNNAKLAEDMGDFYQNQSSND
ncbi:uncharacterized protein RAG0_14919 [Rhynchosporium agropyri]|uniref:DUF1770-domain-containing protein n=1 Tax=Rhynchosporium agropyri TaxID=914238 RepID=A0A1E1LJ31_9HELO|nr:uncharacterized protein RAG0_14919 [Rhynchosporium agropyri]